MKDECQQELLTRKQFPLWPRKQSSIDISRISIANYQHDLTMKAKHCIQHQRKGSKPPKWNDEEPWKVIKHLMHPAVFSVDKTLGNRDVFPTHLGPHKQNFEENPSASLRGLAHLETRTPSSPHWDLSATDVATGRCGRA